MSNCREFALLIMFLDHYCCCVSTDNYVTEEGGGLDIFTWSKVTEEGGGLDIFTWSKVTEEGGGLDIFTWSKATNIH